MSEDGQVSAIGSCFEELAEAQEFEVYEKYARDVLSADSRLRFDDLLSHPHVSDKLQSSGQGFREAVKFYLPKLLLGPVYHCSHYFQYIGMSHNIRIHLVRKEDRNLLFKLLLSGRLRHRH